MNILSRNNSILFAAALLSLAAGIMHLVVVPEHFEEWWGYGAFFLATVVTQTLFAPALLRRPSRGMLLAGIIGNASIVAMWFISRFVGIPFFGPGAGEREAVGTLDVICTMSEIVLVVFLFAQLWLEAHDARQTVPARESRAALGHTTA